MVRGLRRLADSVAFRPTRAAMLALIVVLLASTGVFGLSLRTDLGVLSGDPTGAAATMETIAERFERTDELVVIVEARGETSDTGLDAAANELADAITVSASQAGFTLTLSAGDETEARAFFRERIAPRLVQYLDRDACDELAERLSPSGISAQIRRTEDAVAAPGPVGAALADRLADDPLQVFDFAARLFPTSARGRPRVTGARLLRFATSVAPTDAERTDALVEAVNAAIDTHIGDAVDAELTGAHAIAAYGRRVIRADMIRGVIISATLVIAVHALCYARISAALLAALPAAGAILFAFGAIGWTTGEVSHLGTLAAAMLAGLTIDYAIHAISLWSFHDKTNGHSRAAVLRWSRGLRAALIVTAATSGVAFAALATTGIPAARDFGVLGCIGLAAAVPLTLFGLPALLRSLPAKNATTTPGEYAAGLVAATVFARPGLVLTLTLCAFVALASPGLVRADLLAVDQRVESMHPAPNPPLDAQRTLTERFDRPAEQFLLLLEDTDHERLLDRAAAAESALRSDRAAAIGVVSTMSATRFIPTPARDDAWRDSELSNIDPDELERSIRRAIADSALNPDRFTDYPAAVADLLRPPPPLTLLDTAGSPLDGTLVALEPDRASLLVAINLAEPLLDAEQRERVVTELRSLVADGSPPRLAGFAAIAVDLAREAERELPLLMLITAAGVVIVVGVAFRDPMTAATALIPAALAATTTLSVMAWLGPGWNAVSVAAPALVIGLGVDDGVFLAAAARSSRNLRSGITPTVHAIATTTLTTLAAFGTLALSPTPAIRALGIAVVGGTAAALIATLGVQLPLLQLKSRRDAAA